MKCGQTSTLSLILYPSSRRPSKDPFSACSITTSFTPFSQRDHPRTPRFCPDVRNDPTARPRPSQGQDPRRPRSVQRPSAYTPPTHLRRRPRYLAVLPPARGVRHRAGGRVPQSQAAVQGGLWYGDPSRHARPGKSSSSTPFRCVVIPTHAQVEDARASMRLFMHVREEFEKALASYQDCVAGIPR